MPQIHVIANDEAVNEYLVEHKLENGFVPISVALLQSHGMASGQPAVMLVAEVDGRKILLKTSLQILETMCSAMRAASGVPRAP